MRRLAGRRPRAGAPGFTEHLMSLWGRGGLGDRDHLRRHRTRCRLEPATLQSGCQGQERSREAKEQGAPAGSSHHGSSIVVGT